MNLVFFKLQAVHAPTNIFRFYSLRAGQDLLGDWLVMANYGRLGGRGRSKTWLCSSAIETQKKTRQVLSKRLLAARRIGINYSLIHSDIHPSLDLEEWTPRMK